MSNRIYVIAQFAVHEGKEQAFRAQAELVFKQARGNEPGTFSYEWFIADDGRHCTVIDGYENSDAVLAHMKNVGALMRPLLQMCDAKIDLVGTPSPALMEKMRLKPDELKHRFQGLL
jgi:quinol monooxygenase YgiN